MEAPRIPAAPDFSAPILPAPLSLPAPVLELPKALVPSYQPLILPMAGSLKDGGWGLGNEKGDAAESKGEEKAKVAPVPQIPPPQVERYEPRPSSPQEQQPRPSTKGPELAEAVNITIPFTEIEVPVPRAEIVSAAAVTSVISVTATLAATSMFKRLQSIFKPVVNTVIKKINNARHVPTLSFGRQRLALRRCRRVHMPKQGKSYSHSSKVQHISKHAQVHNQDAPSQSSFWQGLYKARPFRRPKGS
jgi:hypothetical protein